MAVVDPLAPQRISVSRDTSVSDERLNEERAEQARTAPDRDTVGPRRTIVVTEPDGSSKTFHTRDRIWRGPGGIRSGHDWEALKDSKDIVSQTDSEHAIANDHPSARYVLPDGPAMTTHRGIKCPREIVTALDFARAPYPESRQFINGRWLEMGEIDPGSDGTEKLAELVSQGRVIDRKLVDKVKTAAKKVLSKTTTSSKAE